MASILIIGEAETLYGANKIIKQNSEKLVKKLYGESGDLTEAFLIANEFNIDEIYLANVRTQTSYIEVMQIAKQYNFTYIVPLGVRFSDKVYSNDLNRLATYTELFMYILVDHTESILLMTDNHASLYENMDDYLKDMFSKISSFKNTAYNILESGRQLWFVSNNLENYKYANLILAVVMCSTTLPNYPKYDFGTAVFDIDLIDVSSNELIFFKNNDLTYTTVENFINFNKDEDAYKIALIDMVVRQLNRELDLSYFIGRLFNNQVKLKLKNHLTEFLNSQINKLIRSFAINSIESYLTTDYVYIIVIDFTILPMNSLEEVNVIVEV